MIFNGHDVENILRGHAAQLATRVARDGWTEYSVGVLAGLIAVGCSFGVAQPSRLNTDRLRYEALGRITEGDSLRH